MSDRAPKLWGCPDDENLYHTDQDDLIEAILDGMPDPLPEKITIAGFSPMELNLNPGDVLDSLLERLDEDFSNPNGDATVATEKMKEAEKAFLAVIKAEYDVWTCKEVCRKEINVEDWREGK